MQQLSTYRILTYILLPFAALFGIFAPFMLLMGLANPIMLLPAAILTCFCIYVVASMIFLIKGIGKQQPCKPSLKDWIKVNGYVAGAMGGMSLVNSLSLLFYPRAELIKMAGDLLAAQPMKPAGITVDIVATGMVAISYVMLAFSIILLVQTNLGFRLLKKYDHLFGGTPQ